MQSEIKMINETVTSNNQTSRVRSIFQCLGYMNHAFFDVVAYCVAALHCVPTVIRYTESTSAPTGQHTREYSRLTLYAAGAGLAAGVAFDIGEIAVIAYAATHGAPEAALIIGAPNALSGMYEWGRRRGLRAGPEPMQ